MPRTPHANPETIYLTAQTLKEYQANVKRLQAERILVMQRLKEAREMGDLSENGAYQYAKFELGSIGRKLAQLRPIITNAQVLTKSKNTSLVSLGSTVSIKKGEKESTFTIVSQYEADPTKHTISEESPLGKALMSKHVGDEVSVKTPRGVNTYSIVKIV